MKKLMSILLGLSLVIGAATVFAQETKEGEKKEEKKKKKGKKKKAAEEEKKG